MTTSTWLTMIGLLLFVWGGFAAALAVAMRKEREKRRPERSVRADRPSGAGRG